MVKVSFRDFCYDSQADCESWAKWENDPEIRHLFLPFRNEEDSKILATVEEIAQRAPPKNSAAPIPGFHSMILLDGTPVGEMSLYVNAAHAVSKLANTAWISIVIGEARARGVGVGRAAMENLETRARQMGVERIELGVFEHNLRARSFYEKNGYVLLPEVKKHVFWWDGRLWDDLRMAKKL